MLNVDHNLDHWFNTDGFERNASKGPNSFHRHVFPEYIYGLLSVDTTPSACGINEFRFLGLGC